MTSERSRALAAVDRRTVMAGTVLLVVSGALPASAGVDRAASLTDAEPLRPTHHFEEALAKIVGSGTPAEDGLALELPEDAENGNIVPYKISVESPMTDADYIQRIHLLSTQNPQALVATFHLTPRSGTAVVQGRMRLAKTQEVVAVALTSANTLLIGRQLVHVGIGGCGAE